VVNGIDTDRFRPVAGEKRRAVRDQLGLAANEYLLLFVGRLAAQKAPEAFVSLIGRLRRRGLPVRGFLCGQGELQSRLEPMTVDEPGATLLGLRGDIPDLLAACDLFVSTSRNEGLPLNVMEAMTAGAAFTAPDLPQVTQLVAGHPDLTAGLYAAPPSDGEIPADLIETWAEVVATRLADREGREQSGQTGRAVIIDRFSLSRMVREHEAIYASLVDGP
jgi:glycosyltransferase EpsD